jgi:hypothetical protein
MDMDHRTNETAAAAPGHLEYVERLSLHEQFRLVEIAHETRDLEIKQAAMRVLHKCLNPLVTVRQPSKD